LTVKIASLARYPQKGGPREVLQEAKLLAGLGMEGNFHRGGERQLCVLTAELREWMNAQPEQGVCIRRLKENLLLAGVPGGVLPPGAGIQIGEALLRVGVELKRCYDECGLYSRGVPCRLAGSAVFAVVERSGVVRAGDCADMRL